MSEPSTTNAQQPSSDDGNKGTLIGNALNELANLVEIPGKLLEVPGILVTNLIIDTGNALTKALTHIDPTGITPEISSEVTLYIKVLGDIVRIPGIIAQIPGNVIHEFAMIFRGAGFDAGPIIPVAYRYDPAVDGVFDATTNLSTTTVDRKQFNDAVNNKQLIPIDPQEGKINGEPVLTNDGLHFYTYTTNEKTVFGKVGRPLGSGQSQHLFDPEFGTTDDGQSPHYYCGYYPRGSGPRCGHGTKSPQTGY